MEIQIIQAEPAGHVCDALVVGVHDPIERLTGPAGELDRALGGGLLALLKEEEFSPKPGRTALLTTQGKISPRRIIVAGLGPAREATSETLRIAAAAAIRRGQDLRLRHVAFAPLAERDARLRALTQARVEGILLGAYRFARYKSETHRPIGRVDVLAADRAQVGPLRQGLDAGRLFAEATTLARDLVNEPPNEVTPAQFAARAAQVGKQAGLKATTLGPRDMRRLKMGALLGVAAGSREEPRLVVLEHAPRRARRTVGLVGKGLTFDSGGLNVKTAEGMVTMKSDMAGAAAVLGVMSAVPQVARGTRVVGIMALAENMPGPGAMKPGDILRAMNGKTIEITNTDAEGRVVLADAVAYAATQGVDEVIDIATLTGGAVVAMGLFAAAILGTDQRLVDALRAAGDDAGERFWQLPLYDEFKDIMKSPVADLRNSGGKYGSAQKGATFIEAFREGRPWAHLDIAPTAFTEFEEGSGPYKPKGFATGFGVRTLLHYLRRLEARA